MKNLIISLIVAVAFILTGCHTTRKATTEQADTRLKVEAIGQTTDERSSETAVSTTTEVKDLTNVVIEFTRYEYDDGSAVTLPEAPGAFADSIAKQRNREARSKPPNKGLKAVTTGRVTINGDRQETTASEAHKTESEKEAAEVRAKTDKEDHYAATAKEEKKPTGVSWFEIIYIAIVTAFCLYVIFYCWKVLRKK